MIKDYNKDFFYFYLKVLIRGNMIWWE